MTPPTLGSAAGLGVLGTALGTLVLLGVGLPAAEALLVAVVLLPVAALVLALVQPPRRAGWLRAAVGMLVGAVLCVVIVVGLISGVAYLLSDPG